MVTSNQQWDEAIQNAREPAADIRLGIQARSTIHTLENMCQVQRDRLRDNQLNSACDWFGLNSQDGLGRHQLSNNPKSNENRQQG